MGKAITFCLVVVGLINLAPVLGVVSAQKLEAAYSVTMAGNDLAILMRHRALMFGILGFLFFIQPLALNINRWRCSWQR